jgi:hypothetical protein
MYFVQTGTNPKVSVQDLEVLAVANVSCPLNAYRFIFQMPLENPWKKDEKSPGKPWIF